MTHTIYKHDCRPYLRNPWVELQEYDYKQPEQSRDWPQEFQHPLGCKITYEAGLVNLADRFNAEKHLMDTSEMSK